MPNVAPIQSDFSAGEISPRLRGKTGSREYQTGLGFCENFEVTPQGSLELRSGTEFIKVMPTDAQVIKTFKRALDEDVIVVIGTENIYLYDREGALISSITNLITDPTFLNGLNAWAVDTTLLSTVTPLYGEGVEIFAENASGDIPAIASITQAFTGTIGNEHQIDLLSTIEALDNELTGFAGFTRVQVIDVGAGDIVIFNYSFEFEAGEAPPVGTQYPITGQFIPLSTDLKLVIENETISGGLFGRGVRTTMTDIAIFDTTVVNGPVIFPIPLDWVQATNKLHLIQTCQDTAINRMFFTVRGGSMYELTYEPNQNSWVFGPFIPTTEPVDLFEGDQPYTCTIHQGRLWLGGTPKSPSTIWASETWNYDNFAIPETPTDSSPMEFTLASNGSIQWLEGLKNLLIGTDRGEVIGRSSGSVITSTDFDFSLEQTWGSAPIQPLEVGSQVLFITSDFARVRSLFDQGDTTNGYGSADVSYPSENILLARILESAFQQNPDYLISFLLTNNNIVTTTFFEAGQVNAWHRLTMDGDILSITETNELLGTSMWMLVGRGDVKTLEVKNPTSFLGSNHDSYISQVVPANRLLTGLDHLDGIECSIIILYGDGTYTLHTSATPINGEVQLDEWVTEGATAFVGIPFIGKVQTLPIEGANPQGTSQVQKRRFNEIFLRIFNSGIPKVQGTRPAIRTSPTPMNNSESLSTGDTNTYHAGFDDGVIDIEQDLPLPTQITAIFGKLKGSAV